MLLVRLHLTLLFKSFYWLPEFEIVFLSNFLKTGKRTHVYFITIEHLRFFLKDCRHCESCLRIGVRSQSTRNIVTTFLKLWKTLSLYYLISSIVFRTLWFRHLQQRLIHFLSICECKLFVKIFRTAVHCATINYHVHHNLFHFLTVFRKVFKWLPYFWWNDWLVIIGVDFNIFKIIVLFLNILHKTFSTHKQLLGVTDSTIEFQHFKLILRKTYATIIYYFFNCLIRQLVPQQCDILLIVTHNIFPLRNLFW